MSPRSSTVTAFLFINLTSASLLPQNRFAVKNVDAHGDTIQDGKYSRSTRVRRQDLVGLPSWTSPDFCYETGQVRDMASLMVHPPPSKTLDYSSLCSEVLRPTSTISKTSTRAGDSVIIVTSTATFSTSTTTTDYSSHSTITALCPLPTPSSLIRCSIPALGFSKNLLYYRTHLSNIACHELCLRDKGCKSFQIVQQDDEELKYTRCNVYKTNVGGNVSEGSVGGEAVFWDRGCGGVSAPGCTKKPQHEKRDDKDSDCCRLERLPSIAVDSETERAQQESTVDGSGPLSLEENIRVERDEVPEVGEDTSPITVDGVIRIERREDSELHSEGELILDTEDVIRVERDEVADSTGEAAQISADEGIRVERSEISELNVEIKASLDTEEVIRVERDDIMDVEEDVQSTNDSGYIRVDKRTLLRRSQNRNNVGLEKMKKAETSVQAARNGYILSPYNEDGAYGPALLQRSEILRPMRRDASKTAPKPERRHQPAKPKRTSGTFSALPYRLPETEAVDDDILVSASAPESEVIRVERTKRDNTERKPADPLITPAPEMPVPSLVLAEGNGREIEQGIRIEKRDTWTTPDFLKTFFPLFITLACSCLITSAASVVTSSVTEVVQTWNYTTTTSTKSEVYSFTEHPSWSTVYRTVA